MVEVVVDDPDGVDDLEKVILVFNEESKELTTHTPEGVFVTQFTAPSVDEETAFTSTAKAYDREGHESPEAVKTVMVKKQMWHTETVETDVGLMCSLALDSQDRPYISYQDPWNLKQMYTGTTGVPGTRRASKMEVFMTRPLWHWTAKTGRTSFTSKTVLHM